MASVLLDAAAAYDPPFEFLRGGDGTGAAHVTMREWLEPGSTDRAVGGADFGLVRRRPRCCGDRDVG